MAVSIPLVTAGIGAAGSLAGGLGGLFGKSGAQAPQTFQLPNLGTAANQALGNTEMLGNYDTYASLLPQAMGIGQSTVNNPYTGNYISGAVTGGQLGQLQALSQYGQGQGLINSGQSITPWAQQVLQTGFDPQQQLYQQTLAQTMAQQQANNAQSGVGSTPYGAGLTDASLQNFNIAWRQAQLNNQLQALQGAGGALQTGGGLIGQGIQTQAAAPLQYLQASQYPYSAFGQVGSNQLGTLNTLGQFGQGASQIPQTSIQDYLGYLSAGNAANQTANQTVGLQAQLQNMYQNQIGAGLSGLGNVNWSNIFSGAGGGGSSYASVGK